MQLQRSWMCVLMAAAVFASRQSLADDRQFDPIHGKDVRNFSPDPQVKFNHIKLDLRMEKPETKSFTCTETITFTTLGRPIAWLDLNALSLTITSVKDANGSTMDFRYDNEKLTVRFGKELAPATDGTLIIEYACKEPRLGMIFAVPDKGYPDRPLVIHTQGESEDNRHWFVCYDHPNSRFTSETLVTVPARYTVVGNGKLVEKKDAGNGLVQYHHLMEQPHVSYLTSLVIGELTMVKDEWRGKPVEYYAVKSQEADLKRTFGKTPKMMDLFSKLTGIDYPYAKYAQSVVPLFGSGGMENISATTLIETCVIDERRALDFDSESLISHELAHQWFGDMVTCKSWQHLWLNEGFATFMAFVWEENDKSHDDYTYGIWNTFRTVSDQDSVDLSSGVVWPFYADSEETFRRAGSNPYPKGCSAIHMLRISLGDELFWKCIGEYLKRYQWKTAETDDLRKVVDELSGKSYERFFHQWLYRPGVPLLRANYQWKESSKEAVLTFEQTQKVTKDAPIFEVDVDVWLVAADGKTTKQVLHMDSKTESLSIPCDREPAQICIDPNVAILTAWDMKLPESMLQRQLREGPTVGSRLHALRALRDSTSEATFEALKIVMLNEKETNGLRREAATALGRTQKEPAKQILLNALAEGKVIPDPKVRAAAIRALGTYKDTAVVPTLLRFAKQDPAYSVETAASAALGGQATSDEIITTLLANAKKPSGADQIRIAAVGALAQLEDPRGAEAAGQLAAYGQPFPSRPNGIRALGQLGRIETAREKARAFLESLLSDPHERSRDAAIAALAAIGDTKALPALDKLANASGPAAVRQAARDAMNAINTKAGEAATLADLRARIEKLEKQREELEKRLPNALPK